MYDEHMPFRILQGLGYPNFIEFIQISVNKNLTSTYCIFFKCINTDTVYNKGCRSSAGSII